MKLIDRYVAISFLKNYLISFLVLVGLYVVMDMIFNFDELVEATSAPQRIVEGAPPSALITAAHFAVYVADFYFYQVFVYFKHLSGVIPVAAAGFTLMRMVRFNELTALLASGVPLLRIAMPVVVMALALNGLLWVDQEVVVPSLMEKISRRHDHGVAGEARSFAIFAMRDDENDALLFAGRYYPHARPPRMDFVRILGMADGQPASHIHADAAMWEPTADGRRGRWRLVQGRIDLNLSRDAAAPVRSEVLDFYEGGITPEEIHLHRSGRFVELLSTRRIRQLLERPRSFGQADLLRVVHARGPAQIMLNMTLVLLAIACVLTREPQQLKTAATRCVLLCGACLGTAFFGQEMAYFPPPGLAAHWPVLMAWLPVFVFGPLAIWLLDRVRT